jgi:signal transduction histidine kinase
MKKLFTTALFFSLIQFSYANNCDNNDYVKALPEEVKSFITKANAAAREDVEKAILILEEAKTFVNQSKTYDSSQKNDILHRLEKSSGIIYEENNELDKAKICYLNELKYVDLSGNKESKMGTFIDLAIVEKRKGNFKEAREYYLACLTLAEKENNLKLQDFSNYGLGTLYEASGEFEKAVGCYMNSLKFAEARGSRADAVNTLQNLAITYSKLNNNKLALETIEKASLEIPNLKDSTLIASIIFDYGKVLNANGKNDEAILKFEQSRDIFKALNFKPLIARSLFYLADTYTQKGDFEKSKATFLECEKYQNFISKRSNCELHIKLGELYLKENELTKANQNFLTSFDIAQKCNYRELLRESSYKMSVVYQKMNDFGNAFKYLNISTAVKDSIFNETNSKSIAELQLKYDTEKSQREIDTLLFQQRQLWYIFGATMLLILVGAAFYLVRLTRKNNKELKVKNFQIQEQIKLLTEQNASLEQFAYAAAHDLKEPLRNIGSFVNLLQRRYNDQFDDSAKEYMGFITSGVKRMNDLLVGLLNLSSLTSEKADNGNVNFGEVIDIVKSNLKVAIDEKEASINFDGKVKQIPMNQLHLIQLVQNILSNALKFVEKKPEVQINTEETEEDFQIIIKDNGIGMDKTYESKVFRLFQRLDKTKNYEGNGVGLSICKNIVEKYGGKIWYESEIGSGTQFYINIPKLIANNAA